MNANAQTAAPWQNAEIPQDHLPEVTYPLIQWFHGGRNEGNHPLTEMGGFLMSDDQRVLAGFTSLPGFQSGMASWGNACHVTSSLDIAVIAYRRRWEENDGFDVRGKPRKKLYPWNQYDKEKRMTGKYHFLVVVRGMEAAGPVVITVSGTTSKAMRETYNLFCDTVVKAAESLANKRFPGYAFWMTVKPGAQGREANSGKMMTYPTDGWSIPENPEARRDYLYGLYTGVDVMKQVAGHWETAQSWRERWDSFKQEDEIPDRDPNPTYTQVPAEYQQQAAAPSPTNGRQELPVNQAPPAGQNQPPMPDYPVNDDACDVDGIPF